MENAIYNTLRVSQYYMNNRYMDSSLWVLNKMIAIKERLEHPVDLADLYLKKGGAYYGNGGYDLAIESYSKAIEIYDTLNDTLFRADALTFRAQAYQGWGQFSKAIFDVNKAEQLYTIGKDTTYMLLSMGAKSALYRNMGFNEKAKNVQEQSLVIATKKKRYSVVLNANKHLSLFYKKEGNLEKELYILKKLRRH